MHGLYVWWWVQERHVAAPIVAAILAAGDLAVTVLEVPTGWLADRFGHRISLIVGSVLQIAGMLFAWLGQGVPGVLASSITIAAGDAFRSGADQALLYRSCTALGREQMFQTIEGRTRGASLFALVLQIVAGGAIVQHWGFAAGWMVETSLCSIGLAIALAMTEPPVLSEVASNCVAGNRVEGPAHSFLPLLPIILPAALLGAITGALTFLLQIGTGSTPTRVTMVVAAVTLVEAIGAFAGSQVSGGARMQSLLALAGAGLAAVPVVAPASFVPMVVVLCFLMGFAYPIRAAAIQRLASDTVRARAASIASACDKAFATIALLLAGTRSGLH